MSEADHPDYYEIITTPMYLEKMLFKARDVLYSSAAALIADLALLRENCRAYCSESYPSLVEDAGDYHQTTIYYHCHCHFHYIQTIYYYFHYT